MTVEIGVGVTRLLDPSAGIAIFEPPDERKSGGLPQWCDAVFDACPAWPHPGRVVDSRL